MNYRKLKVQEVGTDTYIDYEANVSNNVEVHLEVDFFHSSINEYHVHVRIIQVSQTISACKIYETESVRDQRTITLE